MSRYWRGGFWVFFGLLFLPGCSGPKVIAFAGNKADFASYYTFRIKHPAKPEKQDEKANSMLKKIDNVIAGQMTQHGYEKSEVADIVVSYDIILDNKTDYRVNRTNPYDYPYNNRYYNSPYGYYPYWFEKNEYTEGTLLVELREELSNRLIWQASLDMKYKKRRSSKKNKSDPVEEAFGIIFSNYHYQAGSAKPQLVENQ